MRRLAAAINGFADAYCAQRDDVEARISDANARLEAEKDRFAALLSDLTQGVLVCNSEGRILLYNARAQQLLDERGEEGHIGGAFVGLGRSIFAVIDKSVIVHALDAVRHKLADGSADPSAQLVTTRHRGQLVRANIAPILDRERNVGGFVLTLENITRSVEINSRRDALLQSLTEGTRASLANIRAAIETMLAYPAMAEEHRHRFAAVINDEAAALSARLTQTISEHADTLKAQWPLEDMSGLTCSPRSDADVESELAVSVLADAGDAPVWLSVDSYSVVRAIVQVAARVCADFRVPEVALSLKPEGRFARIELRWQTEGLGDRRVGKRAVAVGPRPFARAGHVAARGGGMVQCRPAFGDDGIQPAVAHDRAGKHIGAAARSEGRPEFYDFDLFNQPGQSPELDERPLADLSYTVFDTETTGLEPSAGDEIISIGAVRIVNGRLLRQESFDQLVDTPRPLSRESIEVHGITPDMLVGQPRIESCCRRSTASRKIPCWSRTTPPSTCASYS